MVEPLELLGIQVSREGAESVIAKKLPGQFSFPVPESVSGPISREC